MIQDLLHALRSLRARPRTSALAVFCLAVGVGANVALFGVVDALLFSPPAGVEDPATLVRVRTGAAGPLTAGAGPVNSYPAFATVRAERVELLDVAAYGGGPTTIDAGTSARAVSTRIVTSNFFDVMGVRPLIGRFFDGPEGEARAALPVVVLGHRFWRSAFDGSPGALGRTLRVGATTFTIVGVTPAGFVGADLGEVDFWVPMGMAGQPGVGGGYGAGGGWIQMLGRLRPGLTLDGARARLDAESAGRPSLAVIPFGPEDVGRPHLPTAITLLPARTMFSGDTAGETPVPIWALGVSGALLLLACATVANLLLAQAVRRRRDVAVRLTLGASPARILRTQLIESSLLALAAAAASALLAWVSLGLVRKLPTPPLGPVVDLRSALFGLAVALATPLVFGVAPALWAARRDVAEVLKKSGPTASPVRLQRGLMAAQIGIAFALLLVGGLFLGSLDQVRAIPLGWDAERTLAVHLDLPPGRTTPDHVRLIDHALAEVRKVPGVVAAGAGRVVPFVGSNNARLRIEDGRADEEQPQDQLENTVDTEYFRALDIPIVAGRAFDVSDRAGSAPVAIVSAGLARRYWPGRSPLGACVTPSVGIVGGAFGDGCAEVVGVAADAKYDALLGESRPVSYFANAQVTAFIGDVIFVRVEGRPDAFIGPVRAAVQRADPGMPFPDVEPTAAVIERRLFRWRVAAGLFGVLGALAALLAAVGVYGLASFIADQRSRELGIRSALGAGRERLLGLVLRDGLEVSALGLAAGALAALALARLFASQLYGTSWLDPKTYLAVGAMLMAVATAAGLRPALLASRADPAVVLRDE